MKKTSKTKFSKLSDKKNSYYYMLSEFQTFDIVGEIPSAEQAKLDNCELTVELVGPNETLLKKMKVTPSNFMIEDNKLYRSVYIPKTVLEINAADSVNIGMDDIEARGIHKNLGKDETKPWAVYRSTTTSWIFNEKAD